MPAILPPLSGLLTQPSHDRRKPPLVDRAELDVARQVAARVVEQATGWLLAADAPVLDVWRELAALGQEDLVVARLVEGHVDATRILYEAGRRPEPNAVYGVWASASGGTGLIGRPVQCVDGADEATVDGWLVDGAMRYCSGAWFIDRALVVISTVEGNRLVEVDVQAALAPGGAFTSKDDTWPAVGMDATGSVDVVVTGLRVEASDALGDVGFYVDREGFGAGGVGVAAVWLGGAAGVLAALLTTLQELRGRAPDGVSAHQRAHLGVMAVAIASADALLSELAGQIDQSGPGRRRLPGGWSDANAARTAVELAVDTVLQRAPRVSGATPLCRDADFAHRMADLAVYVRQHHAEQDYEQLGRELLETGTLLGRAF